MPLRGDGEPDAVRCRHGLLAIICRLCAMEDAAGAPVFTSDAGADPRHAWPAHAEMTCTAAHFDGSGRQVPCPGYPSAEMACCIGDDIDDCRRSQRRRSVLIAGGCWLLMAVSLVGLGVVFGFIAGVTR